MTRCANFSNYLIVSPKSADGAAQGQVFVAQFDAAAQSDGVSVVEGG